MFRRFWFVLIVALGVCAASGYAAAPATQPAKSADGVPFPNVTMTAKGRDLAVGRVKLEDVYTLLLHPPAEIGVKVFSSRKSAAMLRTRLTYKRAQDSINDTTTGQETTHGTKTLRGTVETEWFSIALANADVAGLELSDGVITRIVLFYKNPRVAAHTVGESKGAPGPWRASSDGDAMRLEVNIGPVVMYLLRHPTVSDDVRESMLNGRLARGMTIDQAMLALGKPYSESDSGAVKSYTWETTHGVYDRATFEDGTAVTVGHDDLRR